MNSVAPIVEGDCEGPASMLFAGRECAMNASITYHSIELNHKPKAIRRERELRGLDCFANCHIASVLQVRRRYGEPQNRFNWRFTSGYDDKP